MSVLSVENLSKTFTLYNLAGIQINGFNGVTFEVNEGESLALSGPSGIGKSSVLKCIYGTYLSSSGSVIYHSRRYGKVDLTHLSAPQIIELRSDEIGYVTQFLKVLPRVSSLDTVAEPLVRKGISRGEAREHARELLGRLNIPSTHLETFPVTFSGGEQQRVNIARAIIGKPRLLLLDEPTASLDRASIDIVIELLNELKADGASMVMIFHDESIMTSLAEKQYPMGNHAELYPPVSQEKKTKAPVKPRSCVIRNGSVVTRNGILENTDIVVQDGKIEELGKVPETFYLQSIDASGLLVIPGFIDLHSDAIEKEIQPRPGGRIPIDIALVELDKRLAACGITTIFHCLAFLNGFKTELRMAPIARSIALKINSMEHQLSIHNRIHARYEMTEIEFVTLLEDLIKERTIHFFSLMDHTPGQGQYTFVGHFKDYYQQMHGASEAEVNHMIDELQAVRKGIDDSHLRHLTALCREYGIPMASHDDDLAEKVRWAHEMGIQISEFPVTLEAAKTAKELGMGVLMGAPNILRGKSLTDNLSGREAVLAGYCDLIGSDHSPSNILHSIFTMYRLNLGELHQLINLASYNPAKALGLDDQVGSIEPGLMADLVIVDNSDEIPRIMSTLVEGRQVFSRM